MSLLAATDNTMSGGAAVGFLIIFLIWGVLVIGGLIFWIIKLVEVVKLPDYQYAATGQTKTTWVLVVALLGAIGGLIWQFAMRSKVLAAAGTPPWGQAPWGGPPGYGAPGYGAPGYGAPGYGPGAYPPPSYGPGGYPPPGYGTPGYGPPSYGPGGYPPPGYGPPESGAPGYGPPESGTPGVGPDGYPPPEQQPWGQVQPPDSKSE